MLWYEISVYTSEEAVEAVSHFFYELGAGGVSIEESSANRMKREPAPGEWYEIPDNGIAEGEAIVSGYFPETSDVKQTIERLERFVRELPRFSLNPGKAEMAVREIREEDWANSWKQYYKPVRVTDRLTIKPTWEEYLAEEGEAVIELDPGMAFGTGTHPTTSLCLKLLEDMMQEGDRAIDVGTGSGILSIAAVKLGAARVLALDLDPVAVSSARENVRLNGMEHRITVKQSDLLGILRQRDAELSEDQRGKGDGKVLDEEDGSLEGVGEFVPANLVVANILAEIIVKFVADVYRVLAQDGIYMVSGIIRQKEADVVQALRDNGFSLEKRYEHGEWVALAARKR